MAEREIITKYNNYVGAVSELFRKFKSDCAKRAGESVRKMLLSDETKDREFNRGEFQTYQNVVLNFEYFVKQMYKELEEIENKENK